VPRFYLPVRVRAPRGASLVYEPRIMGVAQVRFADAKTRISTVQGGIWLTPVTDEAIPVDWEKAEPADLDVSDVEKMPEAEAGYADLPSAASQAKSYVAWKRDLAAWLYSSQQIDLLKSPSLGVLSKPGESERDFRIRLGQDARELRDEEAEKLQDKYAPKLTALRERIRKAEQAVDREKSQASREHMQTALSVGETLLGAFTGRKKISKSALSKASSAARRAGRSAEQQGDVARAKDTVEALEDQLKEMEAEFEEEMKELTARIDPLTEELDTVAIKPKKTDITVDLVALAWAPHWQDREGMVTPAW
jgi:hypothetical protein